MPSYLYCEQTIASNITIPELHQVNDHGAEILFNLEGAPLQSMGPSWLHHWLSGNETVLSYAKQDPYHWLQFPGLADFQISANAEEISCYPVPGIPAETSRHLLVDQVLPRCLAQQGKIMLHASAVRLEQGLLIFVGESGTGKSTLAGEFHRAGKPVLSDDCVWVREAQDRITAVPNYGGLRLWEDSLGVLFSGEPRIKSMAHYSGKKRVLLHKNDLPGSGSGLPILAMFVLAPPVQLRASEVMLERLSSREAFISMMKQTFRLDVSDLKRIGQLMETLGGIVPRLPSFRLSLPRNYEMLPLVRQKILEKVL